MIPANARSADGRAGHPPALYGVMEGEGEWLGVGGSL